MLPINQNNEDKELIHAARQDPTHFGHIFQKYGERIYRYLYSHTNNIQEAEDITAQTFLVALESIHRYRGDGHFPAWLFGIARNKLMDHYRQSKTISSIDMLEVPVNSHSIDSVIRDEEISRLLVLLNTLPEDDQELLRLRFVGEMSFPEMAVLLRKKEEAVKKSVYRLIGRLQKQLKD